MSQKATTRHFRLGAFVLIAAAPFIVGASTSQAASPHPTRHLVPATSTAGGESAAEEPSLEDSENQAAEVNVNEENGEAEGEGEGEGSGDSGGGNEASGEEGESPIEINVDEEGEEGQVSSAHGSHRRHSVRLSGLRLTPATTAAVDHGSIRASGIGFTFSSSARARVRVTLSREEHAGRGRSRWVQLPDTVQLTASRGSNHDHLDAGNRLAAGSYRVTVSPAGGRAQSLSLHVR